MSTDLNRITAPSDGFMDTVHSLRNTYGADFVKLVVEDLSFCGIAWLMCGNNPGFASSAFSVTGRACISPNYTFGHELGHNMGSNHAPVDPSGCGAFDYSFGYKDLNNNFRTVMSYAPGARTLHFSNPAATYLGLPTGTATQNNALSIDNVRSTLAGFRASVGTPAITSPPPSSTLSGASVLYQWSANGAAVTEWTLTAGSSPGASDYYASGSLGASLSTTVTALPENGTTVHVRLGYLLAGLWELTDFQYQAVGGGIQVVGDWNNDGFDAPWSFDNGSWQIPASEGAASFTYGVAGDLPVVGDWDGDGDDDIGVFRPGQSPSTFYLDIDHDQLADWTLPLAGSFPQDKPVTGDWDNDGDEDVGVWDSATGIFYLFQVMSSTSLQDFTSFQMGLTTDTPIAGNWDGVGSDELGVFRSNEPMNSNNFYFRRSDGAVEALTTMTGGLPGGWGNVNDVPLVGDWDASGYDTIGLYRPSTAEYFYDATRPRFADAPGPPTTTTASATSIGETVATFNGTVNPNGSATTAYFEHGTTPSYGSTTTSVNMGAGTIADPLVTSVSGLTCNTLYYVRAVGTNVEGTGYGTDLTFTTAPCTVRAPDVTTEPPSEIFSDRAFLSGTVNPNGSPTTAFFEYGTTTGYGNATLSTSAGSGTSFSSFTEWTLGLQCDQQYHFRAVGRNVVGTSYGGDRTFTPGCPPEILSPTPGSELSGVSELFEWTANSATVGSWFLYAGSSQAANNYFSLGYTAATLSATVTGLPTDGSTVWLRFWYTIDGEWQFEDLQYTAAGAGVVPRNPSPADGAMDVESAPTLSWLGGDGTGNFDVYFGISNNPPLVSGAQVEKSFTPGALDFAASYYWNIVSRDGFGAESAGPIWSFTTTSQCSERLTDGGFESSAAWSALSTNFGTPICGSGCSPARSRSGSSWLWFGRTALEQASVEQSVMLPVGAGELTFYSWISDSSGNAQDHMRVLMDGVELFSVVEGDPTYTGGYTQVMVDVSAFANGGTHTLRFESAVTGPAVSNFHVDDVALAGCERAIGIPIPAGPSGSISETTPTFIWSAVADATSYQLVVDNVTDGINVIDQAGIATTSFTPASALTSERDYQWRVVASDGVVQSPFSIDTFFAIDTIAPDGITDLAAGPAPSSPVLVTAPAVESSGDRSDARSKEKATDGDPLTIWSTPARAVAQHEFITMDTASVHRIGRVRVLSRDRGRLFPEDLEVQVSDDNVSFTTVHQVFGLPTTTSTWHTFDFAPAQGRYVRVTITKARKTSGTYKVHIAEIQIYESPIVTGSLSLGWTAPGDNGSLGTAASYALKWSLSPIDSGNFGSATPVTLSPPLPPGLIETATVTGLPDETRLYFTITTSDEVPLTSALSNVADAVTPAPP